MLSIESPCHPPTGALHRLGRPLFQLGQRHAQLQDLLAIARHLPVPRDAPPREIAQLGGELCLPLSNKTCHLLVFTYNCVRRDLSRRLC
jgi:hypothetical protein